LLQLKQTLKFIKQALSLAFAALPPLQATKAQIIHEIQGELADEQRILKNSFKIASNFGARLQRPETWNPQNVGLYASQVLSEEEELGITVHSAPDSAQSLLVGGVPAGNIRCFFNQAGLVVGLQQGGVTVCSSSSSVSFYFDSM
jgi:hypothetical protein